jgi:CheY-like chemotaxis protein
MPDQSGVLEISLDVMSISAETARFFPELEEGRYVKLAVRDNGKGMEREVLDRIFEPYFTTREDGEGSGFGLTIVHGIVKGMGGDIEIESEPGIGTEVRVYFPVAEDISEVYRSTTREASGLHGTGEILLVDDEKIISAMVEKYLSEHGYTVKSYSNSRQAIYDFLNNPDRYDLVMSDVTMPGMTGIELAGRIRKENPGLPIILITGYSERLDRETAERLNIYRCLKKPISLAEITEAVHQAISAAGDRKHGTDETASPERGSRDEKRKG